MGIIIKNVPIEAYHFIGFVERYYGPLHRVYTIITAKIFEIKPCKCLSKYLTTW